MLAQAADLGVLQLHLSGGEPTVRRDLEEIVAQAAKVGLYSNLITVRRNCSRASAWRRWPRAASTTCRSRSRTRDAANADRIAHYRGGHAKKLDVAGWVRALGLPLTINAPIHRQNIASLPAIIELAVEPRRAAARGGARAVLRLGAEEPPGPDADARPGAARAPSWSTAARERLKGILVIDFVVPDYYARRPKPCMGGWGRGIINVTPSGKVLPCHAAETHPGPCLRQRARQRLRDIWLNSAPSRRYRGTALDA